MRYLPIDIKVLTWPYSAAARLFTATKNLTYINSRLLCRPGGCLTYFIIIYAVLCTYLRLQCPYQKCSVASTGRTSFLDPKTSSLGGFYADFSTCMQNQEARAIEFPRKLGRKFGHIVSDFLTLPPTGCHRGLRCCFHLGVTVSEVIFQSK